MVAIAVVSYFDIFLLVGWLVGWLEIVFWLLWLFGMVVWWVDLFATYPFGHFVRISISMMII